MPEAGEGGAAPATDRNGNGNGSGSLRRDVRETGYRLWTGALRRLGRPWAGGENVYEREWDLLVVLDACRVDAMRLVADEYDFVEAVGEHRSPGSNSPEWMEETFDAAHEDAVAGTAYVTANPHSEQLDASRFALVDEVWRYAWDEAGTVRPADVTDRVVDVMRRRDGERVVAHYMQPHAPFRVATHPGETPLSVEDDLSDADDSDRNVYDRLRDGEVAEESVWRAYCDNLRWALDSVETLLANVDADRVVLTADHAELFGEWGCYCHPRGVPVPALRRVPWVETTASDGGSYEPRLDPDVSGDPTEGGEEQVDQRLRDLGYL